MLNKYIQSQHTAYTKYANKTPDSVHNTHNYHTMFLLILIRYWNSIKPNVQQHQTSTYTNQSFFFNPNIKINREEVYNLAIRFARLLFVNYTAQLTQMIRHLYVRTKKVSTKQFGIRKSTKLPMTLLHKWRAIKKYIRRKRQTRTAHHISTHQLTKRYTISKQLRYSLLQKRHNWLLYNLRRPQSQTKFKDLIALHRQAGLSFFYKNFFCKHLKTKNYLAKKQALIAYYDTRVKKLSNIMNKFKSTDLFVKVPRHIDYALIKDTYTRTLTMYMYFNNYTLKQNSLTITNYDHFNLVKTKTYTTFNTTYTQLRQAASAVNTKALSASTPAINKIVFFKRLFYLNHHKLNASLYTPEHYTPIAPFLLFEQFVSARRTSGIFNRVKNVLTAAKQKDQVSNIYTQFITAQRKYQNLPVTVNNYTPLTLFLTAPTNKSTQYVHYKTIQYYNTLATLKATRYMSFFIFFLLNYLENVVKKRIWVRVETSDPFSRAWKRYIENFYKRNTHLYRRFNRTISVRELLEIIILMLRTHDLQIFLFFIKRKFENSHFKKHKKILSILFDVLKKNESLLALFKVKGFFFDIRGKVAVSGNAKKRHFSYASGKISTTSQNVKSYWQQISVWTPTGQMGITCYIQY